MLVVSTDFLSAFAVWGHAAMRVNAGSNVFEKSEPAEVLKPSPAESDKFRTISLRAVYLPSPKQRERRKPAWSYSSSRPDRVPTNTLFNTRMKGQVRVSKSSTSPKPIPTKWSLVEHVFGTPLESASASPLDPKPRGLSEDKKLLVAYLTFAAAALGALAGGLNVLKVVAEFALKVVAHNLGL